MAVRSKNRPKNRDPSLAVVLSRQRGEGEGETISASQAELEKLLDGLGIRVVGSVVQARRQRRGGAFIGAGKLEELKALLAEQEALHGEGSILLAVDDEVRPGDLIQLEKECEVPIVDRTGVVLRVFEQRARTPIAVLEVEIARLRYEAPRVREDETLGDREGGGGRGERGHTNVELQKQRIRERLVILRRKLETMTAADVRQRGTRKGELRVAIVGYTNAGKSSLMRVLTDGSAMVEDKLFATLGSTVRALSPPSSPPVYISDTVGFIRNLPHELVASFHSTLAEAREASLLLHVVDASDPEWPVQIQVTREGLTAVGAGDLPELLVFNKVDLVSEETRAELAAYRPSALQLSALDPADLPELRAAILQALDAELHEGELHVPFREGRLLASIRSRARVLSEAATESGFALSVRALAPDIERWRAQLTPARG